MSTRISEQTKEWLTEALFSLMQHKKYTQISVTEICNTAQLSRKTFYRKFKSKDAVLENYFDKIIAKYILYVKQDIPSDFNDFINKFFIFWEKEEKNLKTLQENHLLILLLQRFNKQSTDLYKTINIPWHLSSNETEKISFILLYSIGGFWNIISNWLETHDTLPAKKLSKLVRDALSQMIAY
ncbi:TetR/AcrR family transcriptional regulator [Ligilactobacillus sp. LYQ135]